MITFKYTDGKTCIDTCTAAEHMKAVVEDFKKFLHHVGYHYDNIEAITYDYDDREARQGLPQQMDWIRDELSHLGGCAK